MLSKTQENRLVAQILTSLNNSDHRGESKLAAKIEMAKKAKENNVPVETIKGIYSTSTYNNYLQDTKTFIRWVAKEGYYSKSLADYFPFVKAYFDNMMARKLSAWTVRKYISALC